MTCLIQEPEKKATCVCSTINIWELFIFSLFWLSTVAFCYSIINIVLKFNLRKNKADNPEHILPAWVAIQNIGFAS